MRNTEWLGPVLLLAVFARNDTANWLPSWYSKAGWFYLLGGFYEMLLCAILLIFLRQPIAVCALLIGIAEGAELGVCRALTKDITKVQGNLCDALVGWPLGAWSTGIFLVAAAITVAFSWKRL